MQEQRGPRPSSPQNGDKNSVLTVDRPRSKTTASALDNSNTAPSDGPSDNDGEAGRENPRSEALHQTDRSQSAPATRTPEWRRRAPSRGRTASRTAEKENRPVLPMSQQPMGQFQAMPTVSARPLPDILRSLRLSRSPSKFDPQLKLLHREDCVAGLFVYVNADPAVPACQNEGWRNHPAVIALEIDRDAVFIFTATGWGDLGRGRKFDQAHDQPLYHRSFCLIGESTDARGLRDNGDRSPVVHLEGARIFEKETFLDLRGARRVRKRHLRRYFRNGTQEQARLSPEDLAFVRKKACELAYVEDSPWNPEDQRCLQEFARLVAEREQS